MYDSDRIQRTTKNELREAVEEVQVAVEEAIAGLDEIDDAEDSDDRAEARATALQGVEAILRVADELRTFCDAKLAEAA